MEGLSINRSHKIIGTRFNRPAVGGPRAAEMESQKRAEETHDNGCPPALLLSGIAEGQFALGEKFTPARLKYFEKNSCGRLVGSDDAGRVQHAALVRLRFVFLLFFSVVALRLPRVTIVRLPSGALYTEVQCSYYFGFLKSALSRGPPGVTRQPRNGKHEIFKKGSVTLRIRSGDHLSFIGSTS